MTKEEAAIVTAYTGYLIGEFHDAHGYMEKVMGRPIMSHEFASRAFCEEIRKACFDDFVGMEITE